MFDKMNGIGAHEVVIETPTTMPAWPCSCETNRRRFVGFRDRILDLKKDRRFKYILCSRITERPPGLARALALAVDRAAHCAIYVAENYRSEAVLHL